MNLGYLQVLFGLLVIEDLSDLCTVAGQTFILTSFTGTSVELPNPNVLVAVSGSESLHQQNPPVLNCRYHLACRLPV